jgi:hypothetical protein
MKPRFLTAMLVYAALGLVAAFTLDDPRFRAVVWIYLGALAVKTWIAVKRRD